MPFSLLVNSNRHLKRKEKERKMTFQKKTPKLFCFCFFSGFLFRKQKEKDDVRNQRLVIRCCFFISLSSCVSFFGGKTKQNKLSNESIYNYNRLYFELSMKTLSTQTQTIQKWICRVGIRHFSEYNDTYICSYYSLFLVLGAGQCIFFHTFIQYIYIYIHM